MATFENIGLAFRIVNNIYGLILNMRDEAQGYKAQVAAGRPIPDIAATMVQNANLFIVRINKMSDLATRNLTLFTATLTSLGLTVTEANELKATLLSVANHTIAASLTTGAKINTEADYILANVPNAERAD